VQKNAPSFVILSEAKNLSEKGQHEERFFVASLLRMTISKFFRSLLRRGTI
jgi:hypothetical protein